MATDAECASQSLTDCIRSHRKLANVLEEMFNQVRLKSLELSEGDGNESLMQAFQATGPVLHSATDLFDLMTTQICDWMKRPTHQPRVLQMIPGQASPLPEQSTCGGDLFVDNQSETSTMTGQGGGPDLFADNQSDTSTMTGQDSEPGQDNQSRLSQRDLTARICELERKFAELSRPQQDTTTQDTAQAKEDGRGDRAECRRKESDGIRVYPMDNSTDGETQVKVLLTLRSECSALVGHRVVRGPDWKWGDQDNGEGHVGTVVKAPANLATTVEVQWDHGVRNLYRANHNGTWDLRLLDNAPTGTEHTAVSCDECEVESKISGIRWKCEQCNDYDICTLCYMAEKHVLTHSFKRFDTPSSDGVHVPSRESSRNGRVKALGIFEGATVRRGPDWQWQNQDGNRGIGTVTVIEPWQTTARSAANVHWASGGSNLYRVGHNGMVDLTCDTASSIGFYYRDHLPLLGQHAAKSVSSGSKLNVGDKVCCELDTDVVEAMQKGHGGWIPEMAEYIRKVGTVVSFDDDGDVNVQYDGRSNTLCFHPGVLTKVDEIRVGDMVRIKENLSLVKQLQVGHGGWNPAMKATLGKVGKVKTVINDVAKVKFDDRTWSFNKSCCTLERRCPQNERNVTSTDSDSDDGSYGSFAKLLEKLLEGLPTTMKPEQDDLFEAAAKGNVETVKRLLSKHRSVVDSKKSGKTALHAASHEGHREVVKLLLDAGADIEGTDEDGDTPLILSAYGNRPEIMEFLLNKGARINAVGHQNVSALSVAVIKQNVACVKLLLDRGCNVNSQDSVGDTPLHDAISKTNKEIVQLLVNANGIDFTLKNGKGFNVLQYAALRDNAFAADCILTKSPQMVNMKKSDNFTALHVAALNGHTDVVKVLIRKGADLRVKTKGDLTPFMLADSHGKKETAAVIRQASDQGQNFIE